MRIRPGGHESQLVLLPAVPALKPALDLPTGQSMQLTVELGSSFSLVEYLPFGQDSHAVALENGFKVGCAMNVPGEQHPKRAVLDPREANALLLPVKDSHVPPQSVRVKALPRNTLKQKCTIP